MSVLMCMCRTHECTWMRNDQKVNSFSWLERSFIIDICSTLIYVCKVVLSFVFSCHCLYILFYFQVKLILKTLTIYCNFSNVTYIFLSQVFADIKTLCSFVYFENGKWIHCHGILKLSHISISLKGIVQVFWCGVVWGTCPYYLQ